MMPAQPGWLVFYQVEPVTIEQVIGNACVVLLADGRVLFKIVRRYGDTPNRYTLESWSRGIPPIENVEIIEARPFAALTPPP